MPTCLTIGVTPVLPPMPGASVPERAQRSVIFHEDVVLPMCDRFGLSLLRADDLTAAGMPADQLLRLVTEADVVIADFTGSDGALSFGLGMRHALGRCTVHVTDGSGSPLAAGGIPSVELPSQRADADAARRHLGNVLAGAFPEAPPTPSVVAAPVPQICEAPGDPDDEDTPGLFDLLVEAETQLEAISGDMEDFECALTDLGAMMELITEDLVKVSHPGASMSTKMAVVKRLAKAIEGPAVELEAAAERFAGRMQFAAIAFGAFLEWAADTPRGEWPEGVMGFLDHVVETSGEIDTVVGCYQEVMALMDMFAASSRDLRRPVRRIGASLHMLFQSVAVFAEWRNAAEGLSKG
ncbi:hypothetical protein ABZ743_08005 [Streptomyces sp. NPDC006662]|uniref:hypothetical protein n=1 Tax=Streptomyces sp. NPDC006662 TaxID=3156902 RepID=UPI0033F79EDA